MSSTTTTYLITGASRGLGLEYTRQLLTLDTSSKIIATARNPATATELNELSSKNEGRIKVIKLDVTDAEQVKAAAAELETSPFVANGIDVLINNAGVINGGTKAATEVTLEAFHADINTNLFGVVHSTLAFLPLVRKGTKKQIFAVSSTLGSITDGAFPQFASYTTSKAAVNAWLVKLGAELASDGFTVIPFHPGYVKTDMNQGADGPAELWPDEAAKLALKNVILKVTKEDNGKFFSYTGETVKW